MPGPLSGFDAIQEIRRKEKELNRTPVPILLCTAANASSMQQLQSDMNALGIDGVLLKPITAQKLECALSKYFHAAMNTSPGRRLSDHAVQYYNCD